MQHTPELTSDAIKQSLDEAGFDLVSTPQLESYLVRRPSSHFGDWLKRKREKHAEQCLLCQPEGAEESHADMSETLVGHQPDIVKVPSRVDTLDLNASTQKLSTTPCNDGPFNIELSVGGMTCASCVSTVTRVAEDIPGVSNVAVSLIGKSATATVQKRELVDAIVEGVEDGGYECELVNIEPVKAQPKSKASKEEHGPFHATFSVGGMTCASCVGNVTHAASEIPGVANVVVNLVGKSATATLESKDLVKAVIDAIEDGGYEAELVSIEPIKHDDEETEGVGPRTVSLRVEGMFCRYVLPPTNHSLI